MMNMLTHGAQYVSYPPYIQRIMNYKTELEFWYDGKHGAYQPHNVKAPAIPPPSLPAAAAMGTSAAAHGSQLLLLLLVHMLLVLVGMHL
jgi:hypothetical protein